MLSTLATSPITYILYFLVAGIFLKRRAVKIAMYAIAIILALAFCNTPLLKYAQEQWYEEYDHQLPDSTVYRYGIILGGYSVWDHERERPEHSNISDRLFEGIRLYKAGRIEKLLLASDGSIIESENEVGMQGNAKGMIEYLKMFGVAEEDIILETKAWNTMENAIFTRELLGNGNEPVLLITSALHMKRSDATFRKAGVVADCYITDTNVKVGDDKPQWFPSLYTLLHWSELLHEWIGYIVYSMRGDI